MWLRAMRHPIKPPLIRQHPPLERGLKLNHLSKETVSEATKEKLPVFEYLLLQRKVNPQVHYPSSFSSLTSLNHFIKTVNKSYNSSESSISVPLQHTKNNSKIQSLFSLVLNSLHYSCTPLALLSSDQVDSVRTIPKEIGRALGYKLNPNDLFKRQRAIPGLEKKLRQLISLYRYGDSTTNVGSKGAKADYVDSVHNKNLKISLIAFLHYNKDYEFDEMLQWLTCIASSTITEACVSLSGLYIFPDFITKDIISRIPHSKYEVDLLIELLGRKNLSQDPNFMAYVENILYYLKLFNHNQIPKFLEDLLSTNELDSTQSNRLLASLSDTPQIKNTEDYHLQILEAQKQIYNTMTELKMEVSVLGCLGLANVLFHIIPSRAQILYEKVLDKLETAREIELANIIKLKFSTSPETLIDNIDRIMDQDRSSAKVWGEFILKAEDYSLLTSKNSSNLYQRYESKPFANQSRSSFIKNIDSVEEIFQILHTSSLDNRSIGLIITKLYQHPDPIQCFKSGPDFARHIFHNLDDPSRSIVGRVLVGETYLNPENSYDLYNALVEKYCDSEPNEKCLLSLIIPSWKNSKLRWGDKSAPQLAVREFRKHVKTSSSDHRVLFPSNETWCSYLLLCGKCNFQEEISEVIQIWQNLKVIPNRKTLSILLGALLPTMAETIRNHGVTNLQTNPQTNSPVSNEEYTAYNMSQWPWPTKHEVEYWRSKMVEFY